MKTNFHTHHYLCGHAKGDVKDYVLEAISKGFAEIGISDHGPLPIKPPFPRMSYNEFLYVYLLDLNKNISEFGNQIKIYKGLEIEYVYGYDEFYKDLLNKLDYLNLALHYYSGDEEIMEFASSYCVSNHERLAEYTRLAVDAMNTKLFKIFVHPDIFMSGYPELDSFAISCINEIIEAAIKNNIALEFNCEGLRKGKRKAIKDDFDYLYPNLDFWKIVSKSGAKVIIGSDCHNPKKLDDEYVELARTITNDLKLNIINSIFE